MALVATIVEGTVVSVQSHGSKTDLNAPDKQILPSELADKPLDELKVVDGRIVEKTPQEKEQALLARRWAAVRAVRDFQLGLSDFESHKAFEGVPSKDWLQIKEYRQMLRDIPQTWADHIDKAEAILGIQET